MHDETASPPSREIVRSRRKRAVRARTISIARLTKRERDAEQRVHLALVGNTGDDWRPTTRADCAQVDRPCPYVGCTMHLYLDVSERTGAIKLNFPDIDPLDLPADASCALDIADGGARILEEAGALMNFTRERTRQVEIGALARIRRNAELPDAHEFEGGRPETVTNPVADHKVYGPTREPPPDAERVTRIFRAYEREQRERDCATRGEPFATSSQPNEGASDWPWTDDDQVDVDRWAVEVLGGLRAGRSLDEAMRTAQAVVDELEPLEQSVEANDDDEGSNAGVDVLGRPMTQRKRKGVDYRGTVLAAIRRLEPTTGTQVALAVANVMGQAQAYAMTNALIADGVLEKVGSEIRLVRARDAREGKPREERMPNPNSDTKEKILAALKNGPAKVAELVEQVGICQSSVNKALVVLAETKAVEKLPGGARMPWALTNGPKLLPPAPKDKANGKSNGKALAVTSPRRVVPPKAAIANGTAHVVAELQGMRGELEKKLKQIDKAIDALTA